MTNHRMHDSLVWQALEALPGPWRNGFDPNASTT